MIVRAAVERDREEIWNTDTMAQYPAIEASGSHRPLAGAEAWR
jgi:hypothetical protein